MSAYCIFCETQKCGEIARSIRSGMNLRAITAKITQRKWVKGVAKEVLHDYLPGYVFLYSEEPITDFQAIRRIPGVLRWLGDQSAGYELDGDDLAFARMLEGMDGIIGIVRTYRKGDRVQLDPELFPGFEGRITKLDQRRKRAKIEFVFDDSVQSMWVGYDMMEGRKEN